MTRRWMLVVLPLLAVVALVGYSNASSIGPVSSTRLNGFTGTGVSGAPTVYASDHFTGTTGSSVHGRSLVLGSTWYVAAGTWLLNNNQAEINGVPLGRVVTSTGQSNVRIVATVADSGAGGRQSGLVFRSDATATTYLSVFSQNGSGGRIYLAKRQGNNGATLVTYAGVSFTNPATWVVEVNGSNITVSYNGVVYITHTLTAADQTTFGSLGGHGLLNDNAATVRYDDFRVESL